MQLNSSNPIIDSCIISNSGSHGLVEQSSSASIQHCQFLNNNGYPLKYNDLNCNSYIKSNTYLGNLQNYIALPGGDYWGNNQTLLNDGIPYHVLDNIWILYSSRLIIKPGVTLALNSGKSIRVGVEWWGSSFGITAEGNADSVITF